MGVGNAETASVESSPTRIERVLAAGTLVLFAAAPFAPDWPRLVTERPVPLFPIVCAASIALAFGLFIPARLQRWWMWILALPYLAFAAIYLATLHVFISLAGAWVVAASFAWPAATLAFAMLGRLRLAWLWHLACTAFGTGLVAHHAFDAAGAILFVGVVYVAGMAVLVSRPRVLVAIGRNWCLFHAITVFVYVAAFLLHQGIDPAAASRVAAQPGVRVVAAFTDTDRLARRVGDDIMMAIPTEHGVILGPHDPERNLRRISNDGVGKPDAQSILLGHRTGDNAVLNPKKPGHWFLGAPGRVIEIREEPFDLVRSIDVPGGLVNFVRDAGPERGLIASRDNGRSVVRIGLDEGDVRESTRLGPFRRIFDVAHDAATDRFIAVCVDPGGTALLVGPAETMAVSREVRVPGTFGFLGDIDAAGRRFFLASFHTGEVVAVDLDSLEIRDRLFVGGTPRNATFDSARRLLYVSDYFGGEIVILRPEKREIVARIATGPRPRQTTLSADGQSLALRSATGVITILVDDALTSAVPIPAANRSVAVRILSAVQVASIRILMPTFVAMRAMGE
ncbi:MAG: hypothetical protein KJ042_06030 [Deltaproteobacteria bacterium]|nr:hypothetical protein [Deltaproteobacteria bacterium]